MRIGITGSRGRLGQALMAEATRRGWDAVGLDRQRLALEGLKSEAEAARVLDGLGLEALINSAAITAVDACEGEAQEILAMQVNGTAPGVLARWAATRGVRMVQISTDYVFGGQQPGWREVDEVCEPVQAYGRSKRAGELAVLAADPAHWVARVSWVFGPEKPSALDNALGAARQSADAGAIADKWSLPLLTTDGAPAILDLLALPQGGVVQVCNSGEPCSWHDWAQFGLEWLAARGQRFATRELARQRLAEASFFTAQRPVHTAMSGRSLEVALGRRLPHWQDAVARYLAAGVGG